MTHTVLDAVLVALMGLLAVYALHGRDLLRAVIAFIALGLLVAVTWMRLRAPDIALAEAAVGSGLTGALLLAALMRLRGSRGGGSASEPTAEQRPPRRAHVSQERPAPDRPPAKRPQPVARCLLAAVPCLALAAGLGWAIWSLPPRPQGLADLALEQLPRSGATNPVTAVLLNYRGYDTLLEVAVLLLAIGGVWTVRRGDSPAADLQGRPLVRASLRLVLPVLVLVAGHLLWVGSFAPGGAFQGGAMLGGAVVLGLLAGVLGGVGRRPAALRLGLALGLLAFTVAAVATTALTGELLRYPAGAAGGWILAIESAATISIGLTLGLLYLGGRPVQEQGHG